MRVLVAGGGIGGLAAALAGGRAGHDINLFEQAPEFAQAGAGVQLGPNVTRVLHGWGLRDSLQAVAAFPSHLQARSATSGQSLGQLTLGHTAMERYGAPYATIHRADLHSLLQAAVQQQGHAELTLNAQVLSFEQNAGGVALHLAGRPPLTGDLLVGADGLWSRIRQQLLADGDPVPTGHLAYRSLVLQAALPAALRSAHITAWLGPQMHVVQYPVRGGDWLNVVAIVEAPHWQPGPGGGRDWDHSANAATLRAALAGSCAPLQDLVAAIDAWRLWALWRRVPMQGAREQARGRVALLGDAAHPMLPYLAQGAGMAIEDAEALGQYLGEGGADIPAQLQRYAQARWQRNARVQARALRNGQIFHASGPIRWGRDFAMKWGGERVLDLPWLYTAK